MAGDLTHVVCRCPPGSDDDWDRLAEGLNADARPDLGSVMEGLRHVSDDIAHDLRHAA